MNRYRVIYGRGNGASFGTSRTSAKLVGSRAREETIADAHRVPEHCIARIKEFEGS